MRSSGTTVLTDYNQHIFLLFASLALRQFGSGGSHSLAGVTFTTVPFKIAPIFWLVYERSLLEAMAQPIGDKASPVNNQNQNKMTLYSPEFYCVITRDRV